MRNNKLLIIGFILAMTQGIFAQQQTDPDQFIDRRNSPYSVYGLGDLYDFGFAHSRAMGGLSNTLKTPFNINPQNPATYSDFIVTNLELGLHVNGYTLNTLSEKLNASDMNISYLALGFPIAKNTGLALGIQPMSKVSYSIFEDDLDNELGPARTQYSGDGDTYRSFLGLGYRYGNKRYSISAGLNYNLMFGKVDRIIDSFLTDESSFLWTRNREERDYGGSYLQYGLQFNYRPKADGNIIFVGGLSGDINPGIDVDISDIWERTAGGGLDLEVERSSSEQEIKLPSRFGFGLAIQNTNGWALGFELERMNWSVYNGFGQDVAFQDATRYALGFKVTPDASAFNNYLKTIQYRAGAYYNTGHLTIDNTDISEIGVTFGFGLPVRRNSTRLPNYSRLNLSFDIGQRGTTDSGLLQENYIKTTFGITLNDKWFVKKKFD